MKKTLIFDPSDTLIEGFSRFTAVRSIRLNLATSDITSGLGGEPLVALTEGRIAETTYWQCVLERTTWPLTVSELRTGMRHTLRQPVPGMPAVLRSLHGHRLVLFSDQAREWWEEIAATHTFLHVFEQRFLSCAMGQTKRHVGTFQRVLAALGDAPHQCLFIDDLSWNVERAESVGLRAHRFTSAVGLRALGIPRLTPANKRLQGDGEQAPLLRRSTCSPRLKRDVRHYIDQFARTCSPPTGQLPG